MSKVTVVWSFAAAALVGCGPDCEEPPGTFEPVQGCQVELEAGEDVFAFCTNRPPNGDCGGPEEAFAQGWLASLQDSAGGADEPSFPTRVGCGPVNPGLVPNAAGSQDDGACCFLMVYAEPESENCVESVF